MNRFKDLIVWQKSIKLAVEVYHITEELPVKEKFNLVSQINRCAVSVPSNIAEGSGRNSNKEFCHFLSISQGSIFEMETQLIICIELGYIKPEAINNTFDLISEIEKMLYSLQNKIKL